MKRITRRRNISNWEVRNQCLDFPHYQFLLSCISNLKKLLILTFTSIKFIRSIKLIQMRERKISITSGSISVGYSKYCIVLKTSDSTIGGQRHGANRILRHTEKFLTFFFYLLFFLYILDIGLCLKWHIWGLQSILCEGTEKSVYETLKTSSNVPQTALDAIFIWELWDLTRHQHKIYRSAQSFLFFFWVSSLSTPNLLLSFFLFVSKGVKKDINIS